MNYGYYMEPVLPGIVSIIYLGRPYHIQFISSRELSAAMEYA